MIRGTPYLPGSSRPTAVTRKHFRASRPKLRRSIADHVGKGLGLPHDRLGGSNSPKSLSPPGGGQRLNSRDTLSRDFIPHRQPLSSVTPRLRASPRGTRDRPVSCVIGVGSLDTSPSGYLNCLAHMLCKILKVEPTLVGRILKVELTCTNLPYIRTCFALRS